MACRRVKTRIGPSPGGVGYAVIDRHIAEQSGAPQVRHKTMQAIVNPDIDDEGIFEAVVSVFDNVDRGGDIVRPGAFRKSLEHWKTSGSPIPVYWSHRLDSPDMNIGQVIEATELAGGDRMIPSWAGDWVRAHGGLYVKARLDPFGMGAQVRHLLKERRVRQFSFSYDVVREQRSKDNESNELLELALHEIGPTPIGMNALTELISAKNTPTPDGTGDPVRAPEQIEGRALMDETVRDAIAADVAAAKAIIAGIEGENTPDDVDRAVAERAATVAAFKALQVELLGGVEGGSYPAPGSKAAVGRQWGDAIVRASSHGHRYKGLTPSGFVLTPTPAPEVVAQGRPVTQLTSLIPTGPTDGTFSWMRHDVRDLRAAPVAPGQRKPQSDFTLTGVQDRARTIAHLTPPINRNDLSDSGNLREFLGEELVYGLQVATESQVLTGDGVGENFLGLSSTPGTQAAVRAGTDDLSLVRVYRSAVTKIETVGLAPSGFVMNPQDWENLEGAVVEGSFAFSGGGGTQHVPLDSSARRAWGIPVVTTPAQPAGTAWLGDWGSSRLWVREDVRIEWSQHLYDPDLLGAGQGATYFETNLCQLRAECRIGFGVVRPSGFVKITLAPVTARTATRAGSGRS